MPLLDSWCAAMRRKVLRRTAQRRTHRSRGQQAVAALPLGVTRRSRNGLHHGGHVDGAANRTNGATPDQMTRR